MSLTARNVLDAALAVYPDARAAGAGRERLRALLVLAVDAVRDGLAVEIPEALKTAATVAYTFPANTAAVALATIASAAADASRVWVIEEQREYPVRGETAALRDSAGGAICWTLTGERLARRPVLTADRAIYLRYVPAAATSYVEGDTVLIPRQALRWTAFELVLALLQASPAATQGELDRFAQARDAARADCVLALETRYRDDPHRARRGAPEYPTEVYP